MKAEEKLALTVKVLSQYTYPCHFDEMGGIILDFNNQMMAEVRGWGKLQYLPNGEELQDAMGYFIADSINKAWKEIIPEVSE